MYIDNIKFSSCIMNASGPKSVTYEDMNLLDKSFSSAIVTKTATAKPNKGNPNAYLYNDIGSINSIGLDNPGIDYYLSYRPNKPYIISIFPDENIYNSKIWDVADLVEVNLSCPNIYYDFSIKDVLEKLEFKRFGIKIAPQMEVDEICELLNNFENISFITCCNTLKNGLLFKNTKGGITNDTSIQGGIGGKYIKPLVLSNVYQISRRVRIPIIGCGGISSAQDVNDYLKCGATAVQIGTHFFKNGTDVFRKIHKDLYFSNIVSNYSSKY